MDISPSYVLIISNVNVQVREREKEKERERECLPLATLASSRVEERNPDVINEALFGRNVSKSSHSTTETGTKEKSLGYVQSTIPKESKILDH